ncbi:MAG: OmpA family protein [Deltaproteobacteria bacterium]|nr:OmpA family protein [Deltaproteobacteria bacterium]
MTARNLEKRKIETNAWMTTYTDLMILLLTFFVLLLSMATIDKRKKRLALNSFVGAFGFKPGALSILGKPKGTNITVGDAPIQIEDVQFERLRNIAMTHNLESDVSMTKQLERTVISLNNRVSFKPDSDQLEPGVQKFLEALAYSIKNSTKLIELRGYVDRTETAFQPDKLRYSMELSSKRAFAVYHFFREQGGIDAAKMVAHGFGLNSPEGDLEGAVSGLNRLVEIILDYDEEIPYRLKKTGRTGNPLDFKGFLFRVPGGKNE